MRKLNTKSALISAAGLVLAALLLAGCYKVTGGGKFTVSSGGIFLGESETPVVDLTGDHCTFAFTGQAVPSDSEELLVPAKGQVQLVDHTAGIIFHGVIDETAHSSFQEFDPNSVIYWGSSGRIKIGKAPFVPVDGFQLNVTAPPDAAASAFIGIFVGDMTVVISATLERGNVTIHAE